MPQIKLTAKSCKATFVLDQEQIASLRIPDGSPPVEFTVRLDDGRVVTGKLNPKTLRKAVATAAAGPAAVVLQGRLGPGDVLADAGLSVQPKVVKETV
jgi:hypothetical protein